MAVTNVVSLAKKTEFCETVTRFEIYYHPLKNCDIFAVNEHLNT